MNERTKKKSGKEFKRIRIQKFCSNKCRSENTYLGHQIEKQCSFCGKRRIIPLYRKETFKYCSMECYGKSLLGKPPINKGIKRPEMTGENHPKWIKDRTQLKRFNNVNLDRRSSAYHYWRLEVYKRDNYKCKINNCDCSGRIIAHHILSWTRFPELRYEINNGITLCQAHHPRIRVEEKRLIPFFMGLMSVSKEII